MTNFLWGVYPYICITLFFAVPFIRMVYRPFSFTTRASGMFDRETQGLAMILFHWGIVAVFVGHVAGYIGASLDKEGWVNTIFYWSALVGGLAALAGSLIALYRRFTVPEVKAMSSELDDYLVHYFIIAILGIALYQVILDETFGIVYVAAPWFASIFAFAPDPEMMESVTPMSQLHIFLAFTFFGYFPFTKLVHFWTLPVNYFVRPNQPMRTNRFHSQDKWEWGFVSDKSYMTYAGIALLAFFVILSIHIVGQG